MCPLLTLDFGVPILFDAFSFCFVLVMYLIHIKPSSYMRCSEKNVGNKNWCSLDFKLFAGDHVHMV